MNSNSTIRNIAIIAHVDHGKTTLVDAMLRQYSVNINHNKEFVNCVMDSGELEKEKGITILAKNTSIHMHHGNGNKAVINIIDTPGHADFSGEVERGLSIVDGALLLVDASDGPLSQTRFVLNKALNLKLPVILVVNKTDRSDSRIAEVVKESHDLLLNITCDLGSEDQVVLEKILSLPTIYTSGRFGIASITQPANGKVPDGNNLDPLLNAILTYIPPPSGCVNAPFQALVANLDSSPFLGRIALIRIYNGRLRKNQRIAWIHEIDGNLITTDTYITEILSTRGITRHPVNEAISGDVVAIAGIPKVMIGDTIADPIKAIALPRIEVDKPIISVTIGVNTSPLSGKVPGHKLTARMIKNRLNSEIIGNVSIKLINTDSIDSWEVQGRGELALAVLIEQMRREGFELTVGKPQVVTKTIDGKIKEPFEELTIDCPEEFVGNITQLLANRKGYMKHLCNHTQKWVRIKFLVPSRGLISFRTEFLTETHGSGIMNSTFKGYLPWAGEIRIRNTGSLVSDRTGLITQFSIMQLSKCGQFFVAPGEPTYKGQVVGVNPRPKDLYINVTREKKATNIRSSTADVLETLIKPIKLNLEKAMEFCSNDECLEVTPDSIRIRKTNLITYSKLKI